VPPDHQPSDADDLILGGLYGLLIGDAVGVPYEFSKPSKMPRLELIEMDEPRGFRAHPDAPPGAWSDDGAQALCLLVSLIERGRLDVDDLGERLLEWLDSGYMAVDGVVFDVGMQTDAALSALRAGTPANESGPTGEYDNGNGSLMRVLPLALWHTGSDTELIENAALQALVTHGHARSQICCALYCLWARATLHEEADPWASAVRGMREHCETKPTWQRELERHIRPDSKPGGRGSGYVVDTLHSARLAAEEPNFERAIQRAISLGDDTDTTAAVAGGIVGLRDGLSSIPKRWLSALAGRSIVDPLALELLANRDEPERGRR